MNIDERYAWRPVGNIWHNFLLCKPWNLFTGITLCDLSVHSAYQWIRKENLTNCICRQWYVIQIYLLKIMCFTSTVYILWEFIYLWTIIILFLVLRISRTCFQIFEKKGEIAPNPVWFRCEQIKKKKNVNSFFLEVQHSQPSWK